MCVSFFKKKRNYLWLLQWFWVVLKSFLEHEQLIKVVLSKFRFCISLRFRLPNLIFVFVYSCLFFIHSCLFVFACFIYSFMFVIYSFMFVYFFLPWILTIIPAIFFAISIISALFPFWAARASNSISFEIAAEMSKILYVCLFYVCVCFFLYVCKNF